MCTTCVCTDHKHYHISHHIITYIHAVLIKCFCPPCRLLSHTWYWYIINYSYLVLITTLRSGCFLSIMQYVVITLLSYLWSWPFGFYYYSITTAVQYSDFLLAWWWYGVVLLLCCSCCWPLMIGRQTVYLVPHCCPTTHNIKYKDILCIIELQ